MDVETFIQSIKAENPPGNLSPPLRALWFDRLGSWEKAHESVQEESDAGSALVHAYLHRKEGDDWNSRYWYRQAGRKPFTGTLEDEWLELVAEFVEARGEKRARM